MSSKAILVLGSNVGDQVAHLVAAREGLSKFGEISKASRLYLSRPYGTEEQPDFLNAAVMLLTEYSPWDLLHETQELERQIGRRSSAKWGPREIDIDIALWEHMIHNAYDLSIPHKDLQSRDFFLRPILDIAPGAMDPRSGRTLGDLLSSINRSQLTVKNVVEDDRWRSIIT